MRYNPVNCPGPGDEATWPPCIGHPNDPRSEPDERGWDELSRDERIEWLARAERWELRELIEGKLL
jgi:hypothetical protein